MDGRFSQTIGNPRDDHSYSMEVRRNSDGTWTQILVHADSRLKAAKVAQEAGFNLGGGDCQQVR